MRSILVKIKLFLDYIRDSFFNPYSLMLRLAPSRFRTSLLKSIGACIQEGATVSGRIDPFEPAWIWLGKGSVLKDVATTEKAVLWIGQSQSLEKKIFDRPTIITGGKTMQGALVEPGHITFSFDLEAGVGLTHASPGQWSERRKEWSCKETAYKILDLISQYEIPTTWAVCGHLFLDACNGHPEFKEKDWRGDWFVDDPNSSFSENDEWYMPDLIRSLIAHPFVDIGYHSFGHFNYTRCSVDTAKKDVGWARRIRERWQLPLETFVFPYNAPGHWSTLVDGGFRSFRGYIGQFYLPYTIDFEDFRFYGTSQHVGPANHSQAVSRLKRKDWLACNLFTHPEEWVNKEMDGLERCFEAIKELQQASGTHVSFMTSP